MLFDCVWVSIFVMFWHILVIVGKTKIFIKCLKVGQSQENGGKTQKEIEKYYFDEKHNQALWENCRAHSSNPFSIQKGHSLIFTKKKKKLKFPRTIVLPQNLNVEVVCSMRTVVLPNNMTMILPMFVMIFFYKNGNWVSVLFDHFVLFPIRKWRMS